MWYNEDEPDCRASVNQLLDNTWHVIEPPGDTMIMTSLTLITPAGQQTRDACLTLSPLSTYIVILVSLLTVWYV